MKSILSFLDTENLKKMASRSHFRYGKDLAKNGSIKITKQNTFNILAEIKLPSGNKTVQTEINSTTKGLRWKCSCSNKKNYFCEHCIALGLFSQPQTKNPPTTL
ncbi:MAG: hypothetical protein NVSMB66_4440 [Candidatus Doudnabacteria bacterium]